MQETLTAGLEEADAQDGQRYVGAVLGERYVVGSVLGAGGMGVIFEARHQAFGTRLAVKILRSGVQSSPHAREANERFEREARAASAIGHPNIVDVRDMGTLADGTAYYVMEHLDGRDLAAELEVVGCLPWARVAHIGAQVADALDAAHARGVIHRDLKPENVFLTSRSSANGGRDPDFVKVIDFGIAKLADVDSNGDGASQERRSTSGLARGRDTASGLVLGTPVYMSPEQCASQVVDARSDIYSLGVLLYEALLGRPPFEGEDMVDLMLQHQTRAPLALSAQGWRGPDALEALVMRCLEKQPNARVGSMRELADGLRAFAPEREERAPSFSVAAAGAPPAADRSRAITLEASAGAPRPGAPRPAALATESSAAGQEAHGGPGPTRAGAGPSRRRIALLAGALVFVGLAAVFALTRADEMTTSLPPSGEPDALGLTDVAGASNARADEGPTSAAPAETLAGLPAREPVPPDPSSESGASIERVEPDREDDARVRGEASRRSAPPHAEVDPRVETGAESTEAEAPRSGRPSVLDLVADPWGE